MKYRLSHLLMFFLVTTLVACAPITAPNNVTPAPDATAAPQGEVPLEETPVENLAMVDAIGIRILESDPVQVEVVVRGNLADGCTQINETLVSREGNQYQVILTTQRPPDAICTQALVPFEEIISLDIEDASPGEYTVDVNGVVDTFSLGNTGS